jgi:hypothetical protein
MSVRGDHPLTVVSTPTPLSTKNPRVPLVPIPEVFSTVPTSVTFTPITTKRTTARPLIFESIKVSLVTSPSIVSSQIEKPTRTPTNYQRSLILPQKPNNSHLSRSYQLLQKEISVHPIEQKKVVVAIQHNNETLSNERKLIDRRGASRVDGYTVSLVPKLTSTNHHPPTTQKAKGLIPPQIEHTQVISSPKPYFSSNISHFTQTNLSIPTFLKSLPHNVQFLQPSLVPPIPSVTTLTTVTQGKTPVKIVVIHTRDFFNALKYDFEFI